MITISCAGAELVAKKLLTAAAVVPRTMPDPLAKCGLLVVRRAKQKAPVKTGHLKGAISMDPPRANYVDVISHADYSVYVEFGTSKMKDQPFMGPALDESKAEIESILGRHVTTTMAAVMA